MSVGFILQYLNILIMSKRIISSIIPYIMVLNKIYPEKAI